MQVFSPCVAASGGGGGAGQNRFGTEARGRFCCCICAAGFQRFSLSAVGVVALAPATAVQLDVGARRLAVASGAEEADPCIFPQHVCLRDDCVGDKFVAVLRQVNVVPVSMEF